MFTTATGKLRINLQNQLIDHPSAVNALLGNPASVSVPCTTCILLLYPPLFYRTVGRLWLQVVDALPCITATSGGWTIVVHRAWNYILCGFGHYVSFVFHGLSGYTGQQKESNLGCLFIYTFAYHIDGMIVIMTLKGTI